MVNRVMVNRVMVNRATVNRVMVNRALGLGRFDLLMRSIRKTPMFFYEGSQPSFLNRVVRRDQRETQHFCTAPIIRGTQQWDAPKPPLIKLKGISNNDVFGARLDRRFPPTSASNA